MLGSGDICPVLQMKNWKLKGAKRLTQGHIAHKWQRSSNPGVPAPTCLLFPWGWAAYGRNGATGDHFHDWLELVPLFMGEDNFPLAPFLSGLALNVLSSHVAPTSTLNQWMKMVCRPGQRNKSAQSYRIQGVLKKIPSHPSWSISVFTFLIGPSFIHLSDSIY